jgi:NitT/TauT family transport system substrate-binding protein
MVLDEVTLNTSFLMDGAKAPVVLGKEKGFFEEQGIDVTLIEGTGSSATVQFIATKTHDFGLPGAQVVARAVNEGLPVVMVANHTPRGQEGIFVRADSPIQTLADFVGRSVVVGLGQQTSVLIRDVFVAAGVDPDAVNIVEITEEGKNLLFLEGQYDGTATPFESIAVMQQAEPGLELRFFPFADYGLDTMSSGLVTHVDTVAQNPDLVRRLVAAYAMSYLYAAEHPDELIEVTSVLYPSATPEILSAELEIVSALRDTPNTVGHPFGWMAPEDWDATLAVLVKTGAIDEALPHDSYYTNEFIGDWEHLPSSGPYADILGGG